MFSSLVVLGLSAFSGAILFLLIGCVELGRRGHRGAAGLGLTIAVLLLIGTSAVLGSLLFPCGPGACDLDAGVRAASRRTRILDRTGSLIGILEVGRSPWIPLDQVPEFVRDLVVQREDRRFWAHGGVDVIGVMGALKANLRGHRRGASTIAMQVAQLTMGQFGLGVLPPDGTFPGKLAELAVGALLLDKLGHERVLEIYLNSVPMGPVYGFEASARREFGTGVSGLTVPQAASLAAMIKAPSRLSPCFSTSNAEEERRIFLSTLADRGSARRDDVEYWAEEPLVAHCPPRGPKDDALRAIRDRLEESGDTVLPGDSLRTHIDLRIQSRAWDELKGAVSQVDRRSNAPGIQGVAVVLGEEGEIRAWISARPGNRTRGYDRVRFGRIRYGSTLKPFLMASALERGLIDLEETLRDVEARTYLNLSDPWISRIRSGASMDLTVEEALSVSENWLAVLLWHLVPEWESERLTELGIPLGNLDHPTSALGTGVLAPTELAAAFSSLLTDGQFHPPRLFEGSVLAPGPVAWRSSTVSEMRRALQGVAERGTGRQGGIIAQRAGFRLGLKTGTVANTSGWTQELVIVGSRLGQGEALTAVMWIGCDQPTSLMRKGTAGEFLAGPLARVLRP